MNIGNFAHELAQLRTEQEREAEIRRARAALQADGAEFCEECGRPIGAARRQAIPSATRCISCQEIAEGGRAA